MTTSSIRAFPIKEISTHQLFLNIEKALGLVPGLTTGVPYTVGDEVLPEAHFYMVERVLKHLLGDDTGFSLNDPSTPDAEQANRLALIYQGKAAYALCAEACALAVEDVTPWHIHQFFARLAWLNERSLTSEQAHSQLNQFLYASTPFWSAADSLGSGSYSELGALFDTIPQALCLWMVQFKRGARLVPIGEWIAMCTPDALYAGLAAQHAVLGSTDRSSAPDIVWQEVSWLFAPREYDDKAVLAHIEQQLPDPRAWTSMVLYLEAIPEARRPHAYLQVDLSTHIPRAARAEFLRKVVTRAFDAAPWLSPAIDAATAAPGMRALSLAIKLRFEHAQLSFDQAIGLAALSLLPALATSAAPVDALPASQAISEPVPSLDTWCSFLDPDDLFRQLGIALLCHPAPQSHALRLMPRMAWQALVQTAQFQDAVAPLLRQMHYFGAAPGEQASPRISQALAGRAIVEYFLGATDSRQSLALMLRGAWVCQLSHKQLSEKVRNLIVARQPNASASTHDMLHYLLLREAMPELLVTGVPDHLQYGRSLQSVALIHSVTLVEAMTPGLSLTMPFNELINVSVELAQSTDASVHALWARTLVMPALLYAIAHGEIDWAGDAGIVEPTPSIIGKALEFLKAQQELHAQSMHQLISLKAPDRRAFAQNLLRQAGIAQWLWDQAINVDHWPILQDAGFTIRFLYSIDHLLAFGEKPATVVELVMMGEAYIAGQPTAEEAYASAFEAFHTSLISAQAGVIKRLFGEMSPAYREVITLSTCELNRVQFGNKEGDHGLLIRCQQGDQREHFASHMVAERFFEVIPACGVVREVSQSFHFSVPTSTWNKGISLVESIRLRNERVQKLEQVRLTPLIAMDSDAYLTGTASASLNRLHAPLMGMLIPAPELVYGADANTDVQLESLAHQCAKHLLASFLEQSRAQHLHQTDWEKKWAKEREFADTVARLLIPFYGCVKDLAAGDHSAGVVIGCALDMAFALIPMGQFVGSTARIILRAGELSVVSIAEQTGTAVLHLAGGLAQQSGVFLIRDLGRAGFGVTRAIWSVLNDHPGLKRMFTLQTIAQTVFGLDKGAFRIADSLEHPWQPRSSVLDRRAVLDGRPDVLVRNIGSADEPDFRLLDPQSDAVFGKQLTTLSALEPVQLSRLSIADRIAPGHYPPVLPVALEDGVYEAGVAEGCQVRVLDTEDGVYTLLIDEQVYRLNTKGQDAALRKLAVVELSPRSRLLEQVEGQCRVRRTLVPSPCPIGLRLRTPQPEPMPATSSVPEAAGKYFSDAMLTREFVLQRITVDDGLTRQSLNVFVHEGKFCTWDGQAVTPLSEEQITLFALPETPVYKPLLEGRLWVNELLGLPANFTLADVRKFCQECPVIGVYAIANGVDDSRLLRGIRVRSDPHDWMFIEPDVGVFYKASMSGDQSSRLNFERLNRADTGHAEEISEFLRLSEEYRLVRERPGIEQDRENIARLLFDLLEPDERPIWGVFWGKQVKTYDEYVEWCIQYSHKNKLLHYSINILAGEDIQKKFFRLAKNSISDFRKIVDRGIPERQHIVEVLNQLLPVQGNTAPWEILTYNTIVVPKVAKKIMRQVNAANLAFAQVYTVQGERIVYYSLSGGYRARNVALRLDVAGRTETRINGVIYRDARARMASRAPDMTFTSLPVVRHPGYLTIREFDRHLDSERLIATVLKEDMMGKDVTRIHVFTVLDTCRSCGGMVLPRLKADFPGAAFSVTYLKKYGADVR